MPPIPKAPSVSQLTVRIAPNASIDEITKTLQQVLTLPKLPGHGGCQPCFSGLDKFVFENPGMPQGG